MKVPDTLSYLLGSWSVERRIDDQLSGQTGLFAGSGSFAGSAAVGDQPCASVDATPPPAPSCAYYREVGTLRWHGRDVSCGRLLVVTATEAGGAALRFPDGRHFVDVDLRFEDCEERHYCGDDVYLIAFTVHSEGCYKETWQVRGPRKDYTATAIHKRTIPKLR
ncbi:MAG: DUF6314 family protein [Acidimicrobiales bacterium]